MQSTRRELLRSSTLLGGLLLFPGLLAACGADVGNAEDSEPAASSEDALVSCAPPVISANHGHNFVVSTADVTAGLAKTYSIMGAASHDHTVALTPADFAMLAAGHAVTVVSSNTFGHMHSVTVTCALTQPPPATCGGGAKASAISANHGHALVISMADAAAGVPKTFSIRGTASHDHQVSITAAQFKTLHAGKSISVHSSTALSHAHVVTVICVSGS